MIELFQTEMDRKISQYNGWVRKREKNYVLFYASETLHEMKIIDDLTDELKEFDEKIVAYYRNWCVLDGKKLGNWKLIEVNYFVEENKIMCIEIYLDDFELHIKLEVIDTKTNLPTVFDIDEIWDKFLKIQKAIINYVINFNKYRLLHATGALYINKYGS